MIDGDMQGTAGYSLAQIEQQLQHQRVLQEAERGTAQPIEQAEPEEMSKPAHDPGKDHDGRPDDEKDAQVGDRRQPRRPGRDLRQLLPDVGIGQLGHRQGDDGSEDDCDLDDEAAAKPDSQAEQKAGDDDQIDGVQAENVFSPASTLTCRRFSGGASGQTQR